VPVSVEVLLRWHTDVFGNVSPDKIIPIAEEIGIVGKLSNWIIYTAGCELTKWKNNYNLTPNLAINISAKQYFQRDFVEAIINILTDIDLSPNYLQLEINENLIMQDPDYSLETIHKLKTYGVKVVIDNFGTGYSSINYLHQFKVDAVKISREIISGINSNALNDELIQTIVSLAKQLHLKVIAEGIESLEQYTVMQEMGCDEFQGYYISRPLSAENLVKFLENYQSIVKA
jgi:EAL domain-containing protein (putative c-di-GMP-specific phosphodiesterase class I)